MTPLANLWLRLWVKTGLFCKIDSVKVINGWFIYVAIKHCIAVLLNLSRFGSPLLSIAAFPIHLTATVCPI